MSEANKTEELHHTQTDEQIHILLSTVAELQQRVSSLENGSKQKVSNNMKLRTLFLHFKITRITGLDRKRQIMHFIL